METFWCHNVTWKSGCFSANEIDEYSFRLSIGFGQIFLEFNPVDVTRVDPCIPAVAAVEEQILLVRWDSRSVLNIGRINPRAQISRFGPGSIRQAQGQVQVFMPITSRLIHVGEYHVWLIRSNASIACREISSDKFGPGPGVAHKRGDPHTAFFGFMLACGTDVDTVIRCYRAYNFFGRRTEWRSELLRRGPSTCCSIATI